MKELIEQVVQWGRDRGLDKVGHLAQAKYTLKETAELLDAYADGDADKMNDAIGDIAVTLIVGASNSEEVLREFETHLIFEPNLIPISQRRFINNYFEIVDGGIRLEYFYTNNIACKHMHELYIEIYNALVEMVGYVNYRFNQALSLKDCLQLAYDEIKNRKGKLVNGQFIKAGE